MASEALPLLRARGAGSATAPEAVAGRAWRTLRRALVVAGAAAPTTRRVSSGTRAAGRLNVGIDLAHLKRVGDQIDRAANRLSMALVIASLVIGSSIVMTVQGGPTLLGLPAFGFLGFLGAFMGGAWARARAIWRSSRGRDHEADE